MDARPDLLWASLRLLPMLCLNLSLGLNLGLNLSSALASPVAMAASSTLDAAAAKPLALPELRSFEADSLAAIVASERGHGFWLVLWDLECPYCMKTLRLLAAHQKTDRNLRVVTVATDDIGQSDQLRQRLQEIGIQGSAWAFGEDSAQALRYAVDPGWRGEKPRAYYYDANGGRKAFTGVLDPKQIQP
jgi:hypothetical protein